MLSQVRLYPYSI